MQTTWGLGEILLLVDGPLWSTRGGNAGETASSSVPPPVPTSEREQPARERRERDRLENLPSSTSADPAISRIATCPLQTSSSQDRTTQRLPRFHKLARRSLSPFLPATPPLRPATHSHFEESHHGASTGPE